MFYLAFDQIGHRFDPAVRMPGNPLIIIIRIGRVKRIQHQERIKIVNRAVATDAHQVNAGAIGLVGAGHDIW